MTDKHRIRTERPVSRILTAALETASDLDKAGHSAAVVGGAVRDTLLGREICDADIATSATMHEIISIWPHCRLIGKPPMTTALLVKEGIKLDIASFQGRCLEEDLGRRDLTINAMAMTPGGETVDPWGGSEDIASGTLRFTNDPIARLKEDPLRALRLARFSSALPRFSIDPSSAAVCPLFSTSLALVPLPRIGRELLSALGEDLPILFGSLEKLGILEAVMPFLAVHGDVSRKGFFRRVTLAGKMTPDQGVRGAAMLADAGEGIRSIMISWGWPRSLTADVAKLARWLPVTVAEKKLDPVVFGRLFRAMGSEWIDRLFLLGLISCLAGQSESLRILEANRAKAEEYSFRLASFGKTLTGQDIMNLIFVPEGPLAGEAVSAIYGAIAEGTIKDREEIPGWISAWFERMDP